MRKRTWIIPIVLFLIFYSVLLSRHEDVFATSNLDPSVNVDYPDEVNLVLNQIVLFNYTNRQTMTSQRLKSLISDVALPTKVQGHLIQWSSTSSMISITSTPETFSVRDISGTLIEFDVLVAQITNRPNVFQGNHEFSFQATIVIDSQTYTKTFEATLIPMMPSDFWGGVIYTVVRNSMLFLEGVLMTLGLSLAGTVIGFIFALLLVSMRLLKDGPRDSAFTKALKQGSRIFSKFYVTVFRGTPMIVQAAFFWYGLNLFGNPVLCGLFVVSVNTAAYITEILRGSIQAIDKGQLEAARSIGMSNGQAMRYVILPQAIKNAMPAIGNEFVINIKDTAVLSVIEIYELFYQTKRIVGNNYRQLEAYLVVALIYLFLTYTVTHLLQAIERRFDLPLRDLPSSN